MCKAKSSFNIEKGVSKQAVSITLFGRTQIISWSDTGATSDGAPCFEPKLSSTKVLQTLSNLTLLPH